MSRLLAFFSLRSVNIALSLLAAALLGSGVVATIYLMEFSVMWLAFLGGMLFAAVVALASLASRAEWVNARRALQIDRMREQLNQEIARGRNAAEAMRLSENKLRLVTDALPGPLLYIDRDGRCHYHNRAVARLSGLPADKINGQFLRDIVGNTVYLSMVARIEETLSGRTTEYDLTWDRPGSKGATYTARQVPYPPGELQPQGFYLMLTRTAPQAAVALADVPRQPQPAGAAAREPAANAAQLAGEGGQSIYLDSMTDDLMGWDDPRTRLERAIEDNQFLLFAQKMLALKSGLPDPVCFEVLLRLQEEEDNFLPPGGFLPLAERYGMMEALDRWVVRNVIAWCLKRVRNDPGKRPPLYCVNLSEASVKSPDFPRYVVNELQIASLPARTLCFEIDESDAINQHAHAQRLIAALKPAGCLHTIDSFGSAKVTFSYLKGLPVDFLKIDGNIIQYILRDPAALAKAKAINAVCQKVGMRAIAEFVESRETLDKLREIGVDYVQGFGIARPAAIDRQD